MSLGEMLDAAIKVCLANWRTLLKTVLIVVVPVQIVSTLVNADYTVSSFDFDASSSRSTQESLDELNQYLGGLAISTLLQLAAVGLATAACFRAIAADYLAERPDWRASLAYAVARWRSLLLVTALYVVGVGLGTLLFVAPGVWLFVAWAVAMPVLLVEGQRGSSALRRSFVLVQGRWWRTFGTLLVGFILAGILSTVVQGVFVFGIVAAEGNDALVLALSALSGIIGMVFSAPLQAALLTVVYFDLRVRKEGYDLELLAHELGTSAPAAAAVVAAAQEEPSGPRAAPPPPGWGQRPGDAG